MINFNWILAIFLILAGIKITHMFLKVVLYFIAGYIIFNVLVRGGII